MVRIMQGPRAATGRAGRTIPAMGRIADNGTRGAIPARGCAEPRGLTREPAAPEVR